MNPGSGSGKGVSKHQPWPADLSPSQVIPFPGNPCERQEYVRQAAFEVLLAPAEQSEYDGHLESVRKGCEYPSSDSGIAYPEGRREVPCNETQVMPPEEPPYAGFAGKLFCKQERYQADQGQEPGSRHQERQAHEADREQEEKQYRHLFGHTRQS